MLRFSRAIMGTVNGYIHANVSSIPINAKTATVITKINACFRPIAFFTTNPNPDLIDWVQNLMSGLPAAGLPGNIRYVSDDVIIVNRHGNSIIVELTAPQTILMGTGPVVVPAFTVELNKVGGSVHQDETVALTGYPDASGYTGYVEEMGFNAEGAFTCSAWSYDSVPMTDCFITMHGITIYTPPA
jgi:hypothetical protein